MQHKKGDVDPETGLVYWSRDKTRKGGIRWVKADQYEEMSEKQKQRSRAWRDANKDREKARLARQYRENKERENEKNRRNYFKRRDEINAHRKIYREANKEQIRLRSKKWREEKAEHCKKQKAKYYQINKDRVSARVARWQSQNKDKIAAARKRYYREVLVKDPVTMMKTRARNRIAEMFRKKAVPKRGKTKDMLGCEWETLKDHIEGQFRGGMTWENRNLWHIDHIVPLASAETEADLIKLCHYTNLQPMWARENKSKNAKCPVTGVDYRKPPAPKRVKRSTP